ncbi:MAG TPA: hypothetical protein VN810_04145 [Terriglobales bacterium]|nr:hypothetical protein [Terriglobales bacterium]
MRFLWMLALAGCASAACLPMEQASRHVGETACVHGKVLAVSATPGGTHLLRFCEEGRECGFSAVVFRKDLRQVGDVRTLQGKEVDIQGQIRLYHGHPEVIVRDSRQLKGEAARLPPIPKNYDVPKQGKASPGQRPSSRHKPAKYSHRSVDALTETTPEPE